MQLTHSLKAPGFNLSWFQLDVLVSKFAFEFNLYRYTSACALVAYDAVKDPRLAENFCADHRLHGRTMREMSDLRRQLLRILSNPPPSVVGLYKLNFVDP
jgi:hypothetical protein